MFLSLGTPCAAPKRFWMPTEYSEINDDLFDDLDRFKQLPIDVVSTPYPTWNAMCRDEGGGKGLARGWYVVYGAKTGTGKSIMALNLACHAFKQGAAVGFISLEMSLPQLVTRSMSIFSGISVRRLEHGKDYSSREAQTVKTDWAGQKKRTGGTIWLNPEPVSELGQLEELFKDMVLARGCRFVLIDYLQLVWTGNARQILDRITEVSAMIRRLTKMWGVTTVGLSQFNREGSRSENPPVPTDLMGGSPLENDADQVVLLDHTSTKDKGDGYTYNIMLAKNRHGETGTFPALFDRRTLRISEHREEAA